MKKGFTLAEVLLPHPACQRKFAFTLAEVLITLGIIGVVAAMTMPALIGNYKKQETVSRLKKAYTILNQAYKQAQVVNGEPVNWDDPYTIGIEKYFQTYWYPYLQINKMCSTYQECGYTNSFPWIKQDGNRYDLALISSSTRRVLILPDGILVQIVLSTGDETLPDYQMNVDINGAGKPNKLGKDVFKFKWDGISGIVAFGNDKTEDVIDSSCKSSGLYCAAKIIKDGWEIKDDFPWK